VVPPAFTGPSRPSGTSLTIIRENGEGRGGASLDYAITGAPVPLTADSRPCEGDVPLQGTGGDFTGWPTASHHPAAL